jgi:hypothetical protein
MQRLFLHLRSAIALMLFWLVISTKIAGADGIYIPPEAVEILPAMPHQRAVIIWRDGVEELLVESDFDGAGDRMAWIVSVPAEPTHVAVGAPGIFDIFQKGLLPKTVSSGDLLIGLSLFVLIWCACQLALNRYDPKRCMGYTLGCYIVFYILFQTTPVMYMTLGEDFPAELEGGAVNVLDVRQVGSYEVTTLQASETGALTGWLRASGFRALPEDGEAIVAEYIEEGWCFVAAKLQRDSDGYTRPHPLSITFKTDHPVYPMRLTRLAQTDLFLDLYVIADKQATAPGLKTIHCDRYKRGMNAGMNWLRGTHFKKTLLALPWLTDRMVDQDVLTHLRGEIKTDAMHQDILIDFRGFRSYRQRLQLPEDRKIAHMTYGLIAFGLLFALGLGRYYKHALSQPPKRFGKTRSFLIALLIALPVSQIPRYTSTLGQHRSYYDATERRQCKLEDVVEMFEAHPEILSTMDRDTIEAYILECLLYPKGADGMAGDFTGEGPGRFEVIEDERGTLLRSYGAENHFLSRNLGIPFECLLLTPEGKARPRTNMFSVYASFRIRPDTMYFGYVPVGDEKTLSATVFCIGGIPVEGRILPKPPFYVREDQASFIVKPGVSHTLKITYRPEAPGVHRVKIAVEGDWKDLRVYGISREGRPVMDNIQLEKTYGPARSPEGDIVLINDNDFTVDLEGWGLSNDSQAPFKFRFPRHTVIGPKDYVGVFLREESRMSGNGLSAGFTPNRDVDAYVELSNPDGDKISEVRYPHRTQGGGRIGGRSTDDSSSPGRR